MGRFFGATVVLILVIAVIITGFFTDTLTADYVSGKLEESKDFAVSGNNTDAALALADANSKWKQNLETMLLFVPHSKLDRIDESLNSAQLFLESGDTALYLNECNTAILMIRHFSNLEHPNIYNIL